MSFDRLLIANRGEVAIRVMRTAADLGIATVVVHSEDDAACPHVERADAAFALPGRGPAAYLDATRVLDVAREAGCDSIHPGWGFLSERADFARACADRGITFVGPAPDLLAELGDKARARDLAQRCGVSVLPGTDGETDPEGARAFLASWPAGVVLKAVAGGGGRGMRVVRDPDELDRAFERASSEALAAFGSGALYAERLVSGARHVEVQLVGDGRDVVHLGERDCSLQRRHQKLVEMAPAFDLLPDTRAALHEAALRIGREVQLRTLATVEFLVDGGGGIAFLEANPRLQVEHTVTEAVTGVDLVGAQLGLAAGASLADVGLAIPPAPRGAAVQARVNLETMAPDGSARPAGGTLAVFEVPQGPGVRVDGFGRAGYTTSPSFDSMLVKLIVHEPGGDPAALLRRLDRALDELRIEGVPTNASFLRALVRHPEVREGRVHTRFVDEHAEALVRAAEALAPAPVQGTAAEPSVRAGARVSADDPLAVLHYGKGEEAGATRPAVRPQPQAPGGEDLPAGIAGVRAPLQGTVVGFEVAHGDTVRAGDAFVVMEAMKMEHVIEAPVSGVVERLAVAPGDPVFEDHLLATIREAHVEGTREAQVAEVDPDRIRPDLAEAIERHAAGHDAARPDAVARRRKTGQRTARENVEDLCDPGSFTEYGALVIAAQRRRRSVEDLIAKTPADGMLAGIGRINGDRFPDVDARAVVMSYDYTVLAGTQGLQNHRKKDRLFELAERWRLPVVFFTEGGGGRPGDTDGMGVAGLDCWAFHYFGRLSGLVPLVGINSGRCFAGNAALLGCCDVVIATENSNIGMGGPAMIEGGGLGVFRPEEIGPIATQARNGVVDVVVADEAEAVAVAKRYLAYFQGPQAEWDASDPRLLRSAIPESRVRIYDVRRVIELLADSGSVLELRRDFGLGMVTALARIEGRPIGIVANDPTHLAGAIDAEGADKASRFMQLCDAFDVPLLFLCDTPGIMVGPESEKTALVRHASRMFVVSASLSVPFFTVILRKGYGLGAQAMAGGSFKAPNFTVSWPTGEFGGMGLEGAVKLGYRKELEAESDPAKRLKLYQEMVDRMYQHGKAVNMASHFEIDDVIDPADTRRLVVEGLRAVPPPPPRTGKKRPCIDTW